MSSQDFLSAANTKGGSPWKMLADSTKEQYFSLLNAEQANKHEVDMWRLNNEYNTPRRQMERLIEAGINPAAAFNQVSSGTASSAPGTHQAPTAAFHDQADQLARVNTILGGIRDIMSTVGQGIQAAQGIQDIALRYQDNWLNERRSKLQGLPTYDKAFVDEFGGQLGFVELAPGKYALDSDLVLFPEMIKAYGLENNQRLQYLARQDQHSLVERRNRIDGLVQRIFEGIEKGASSSDLLKLFLELLTYTSIQNYGGGF